MKLLIHDLNEEEWTKAAEKYKGWRVITDNGTIRPCAGCFGCWIKTPGKCVIKDGYEYMGALIHKADEVVVISRYTYGGFSSFVKNVFDRSIGWVLPYFEIYEDEMHHKKRYPEEKPFTFIFRGGSFTEDEKRKARTYVEAVCRNFRAKVTDISFTEDEPLNTDESYTDSSRQSIEEEKAGNAGIDPNRIILLNASLRGDDANSRKFLDRLAGSLGREPELINLSSYLTRQDELVQMLLSAGTLVLGMPLYADGIPSQMLRLMESLEQSCQNSEKNIYCVVNMGFYESHQIGNLLSMVRDWSDKCGFDYCGGLAIGAGEMMGMFMNPKSNAKGPGKNVTGGIDRLARAINTGSRIEDIYADAYRFPRWLYMFAANLGWPKAGKKNGLKKKDLLRRIRTEKNRQKSAV